MKLLLVEDEIAIGLPLKRSLERAGFLADYAERGLQGLKLAELNTYDCIILDLNLPEIDGLEIAAKLKEEGNLTPIIMLTARSQIYDKLKGFNTGADDYVTKPFSTDELVARIKAVISRSSLNKSIILKTNEFELFADRNSVVYANGNSLELSNKETGILEYLLRNKGKIVSAEELLEHVWDTEVDTFTETVKTHIKTLRQKIDPKKNIIKTIRGKGYLID